MWCDSQALCRDEHNDEEHFQRHSMSSNLSSLAEAKRLKFQDFFILWTRFKEFEIIPRIING